MTISEKPIEHLSYYNGQRLDAGDLRLEQEYHIRVRRWLNRSLYSAGIAAGLEVRPEPGGIPAVVVSPGMALDEAGREIILLEPVRITVVGNPSPQEGVVDGNYLVIQYHEEKLAEASASCAPNASAPQKTIGQKAQGGPGRVRLTPRLFWRDILPPPGSGEIVLAQVELDAKCQQVRRVHTNVRIYVGQGSAALVRQFALEGEKDIDHVTPGRIVFHVRGRQPNALALYLRAEPFPSLYYTQMGGHTHPVDLTLSPITLPPHRHDVQAENTSGGTSHTHTPASIAADADDSVWQGVLATVGAATFGNPPGAAAFIAAQATLFLADALDPGSQMALTLSPRPFHNHDGDDLVARVNLAVSMNGENLHTHPIPAHQTDFETAQNNPTVLNPVGNATTASTGATDAPADTAPAYTFVQNMEVWIDGIDQTGNILNQLRDVRPPNESWQSLGDNTSGHPLAMSGTGEIKLDFLPGAFFGQGEHVIELRVPVNNGGRVQYNLYVE